MYGAGAHRRYRSPDRWLIHDAIKSRTCGATVSSMLAYSAGKPVLAGWNK
jgi:hypothetical protein